MAAFSVFFMQSPSFLAHQRQLADGRGHGCSNCETLFGMGRIPSDNHVRDMLDPVAPEHFHPLFPHALEALEAGGGLIDWGGGDILYYASRYLEGALGSDRYRAPEVIANNMRDGRIGMRTGAGFLDYDYSGLDLDAYREQRLAAMVA